MTRGGISQQRDVDIRPASHNDAEEIAAVHIGSFLATYSHLPRTRRAAEAGLAERVAVWTRRLKEPETGCTTFVATDGGRVCGFVHVGPSPDSDDDPGTTGQILSIHVEPEVTGGGIGSRLMARAMASLHAAGYTAATLWVVAENRRAGAFYERLGWRLDGARRREMLAVEGEEGDVVTVVRYRFDLRPHPMEGP
ncbi:MAG: GNAT family N-acetyltransferase [Acidimicrobiia bacterium]